MSGVLRDNRIRVELYDHGANHGPGDLVAMLYDMKDLGVSEYANEVGELFFTIPIDHPNRDQIVPLQRHYRVVLTNGSLDFEIAAGVLEDFEQDENEIVVYGHDYMGLLETSISGSSDSYTGQFLGTIVSAQISAAITESNSRLAFTSLGTIENTSVTATLLTSYQPRLDFLRQVADVSMSDRSVRTLLKIPKESPWQWTFTENYGQDRTRMRLEYGGMVSGFRYRPGFREFATRIRAIGMRQEGATLLFSEQTYASEATYGRIVRPALFQNITDQTSLDRKTKREARRAGRPDKFIQVEIRSRRIPPVGLYEIGDSVRVVIDRGLANIDALYTIWGHEWTLDPLGRETLYLDLATKEV